MALQHTRAVPPARAPAAAATTAAAAAARRVLAPPQQQQQQQQVLHVQLARAACSAVLAAGLLLVPPQPGALAAPAQLADLLRDEFGFVDADNDGLVTQSELQQLVKTISKQQNVPLVEGEQLEFSMRLFDLNQDGRLTTEELLRSLVLDGAVDEDAVDADVFAVFDTNVNGTIERAEFVSALGDVGGADGEAAKAYVHGRVDHLSGSGGHLNASAFANALVLMRTLLLGY